MGKHEKTLREIMGYRDSYGDIRIGDTVRVKMNGHVGRITLSRENPGKRKNGLKAAQ